MWRRTNLETVTNNLRDEQLTPEKGAVQPRPQDALLMTNTGPLADGSQHSQEGLSNSASTINSNKKLGQRRASWFSPPSEKTKIDDSKVEPTTSTTTSTPSAASRRLPFSGALRRGSGAPSSYDSKDETIASLERSKLVVEQSLKSVQQELVAHKRKHKKEIHAKKVALEAANKEVALQQEHLDSLVRDLNDPSLSEAVDKAIQESSPNAISATCPAQQLEYVHRLESKLSKAMHRLQALQHHTQNLKDMHNEYAKSMQEELIRVTEERVSMEVEHLNRIDTLEKEKLQSEQALLAKLEVKILRIAHLEDMLDELRRGAASANSHAGSQDGGNETNLEATQVETIVAVGALKEEVEQVIRERNDLVEQSERKEEELLAELQRLRIANEAKQKKLDRFETQDALAELENESEHMTRRWNEREQSHNAVKVDLYALGMDGDLSSSPHVSKVLNTTKTIHSSETEEESKSSASSGDTLEPNEQTDVECSDQIDERVLSNHKLSFDGRRDKMGDSKRQMQEARFERYL